MNYRVMSDKNNNPIAFRKVRTGYILWYDENGIYKGKKPFYAIKTIKDTELPEKFRNQALLLELP